MKKYLQFNAIVALMGIPAGMIILIYFLFIQPDSSEFRYYIYLENNPNPIYATGWKYEYEEVEDYYKYNRYYLPQLDNRKTIPAYSKARIIDTVNDYIVKIQYIHIVDNRELREKAYVPLKCVHDTLPITIP